jgi:D-glycero-D-manno-heptose 1,7-bisphosphate phosphatase
MAISTACGAVFLDRDGTINGMVFKPEFGLVDSPQKPDEFQLLPGVGEAIRLINEMGLPAVVVSNQPGVAKGKYSLPILEAVTAKMYHQLSGSGARLDAVYYCLHHPEAEVEDYRFICDCRKPKSGLLRRAAEELSIDLEASYMIGDGLTDVLAGKAVGCTTIFVGNRKCEICGMMEELEAWPDFIASSLLEAVTIINRRHVGQNTKKYKFYK